MRGSTIVVLAIVFLFAIVNVFLFVTERIPFDAQGIGILVAAGLTLAIYSFLYKDNPFFKFAEHLYVGIAVAYHIVRTFHDQIKPNLIDALFLPSIGEAPKYWLIVPLFLGILMFARFSRRYSWVSRWAFAFFVGMGAGMAIPRFIKTNIMIQVEATIRQLQFFSPLGDFNWAVIGSLLSFVGVLCVLVYFFFSIEHKGPMKHASKIGVWFLMIAFGAAFGYTVMGRISLLIDRVQFLLGDWLHVIVR